MILLLMLAIICVSMYVLIHQALLPKLSGHVTANNIKHEAKIYRNDLGIVNIQADNSYDAFYALGYSEGQDRLWQLELMRLFAEGRLSEYFGKDTLKVDTFSKTLGFYQKAKTELKHIHDHRALLALKAYKNGLNAYLKQGKLPVQFYLMGISPRPWSEADSLAIQYTMAWSLQFSWLQKLRNEAVVQQYSKQDLNKLLPNYPKTGPVVINHQDKQTCLKTHSNEAILTSLKAKQEDLVQQLLSINHYLGIRSLPSRGSNAWVVSGARTKSHRPLLANDPHLELSIPSKWYFVRIKSPHLSVTGATIPGLPAVIVGHNNHIAWGVTNADLDTQDLYIESPSQLKKKQIFLHVKGYKDPVEKTILYAKNGPIINDLDLNHKWGPVGRPIALKWSALQSGNATLVGFVHLNYAKNWQMFSHSLSKVVAPSLTFVYADKKNIGAYVTGKVPIRQFSGKLPVTDDTAHQWKGYIPFSKMPHVLNPSSNIIITANNKLVTNYYQYPLTFRWAVPPYRAMRIKAMLNQNGRFSIHDFETMQMDTQSELWLSLKKYLLKMSPTNASEKRLLRHLREWDDKMSSSSKAAMIFAVWYKKISKLLQPHILASNALWSNPLFIKNVLQNKNCQLYANKSCSKLLAISLKQTDKFMQTHHNTWGDTHKIKLAPQVLSHIPLLSNWAVLTKPSSGGLYTVNAAPYKLDNFIQSEGPSYRQVIDINHFDNSRYIIMPGESGNIFSKYYKNLLTWWLNGAYFRERSITKQWDKLTLSKS